MHEAWRAPRKKENGEYEPRMKKSKDEEWNHIHGTDEVDIANCSFSELPSNWQYENLEAARVAIHLVFDKVMNGETITEDDQKEMASIIHDEWLKRNSWAYEQAPELAVSFSKLSKEEQDKDIAQLAPAVMKVQAYINGLIDIEEICAQYNLPVSGKTI